MYKGKAEIHSELDLLWRTHGKDYCFDVTLVKTVIVGKVFTSQFIIIKIQNVKNISLDLCVQIQLINKEK